MWSPQQTNAIDRVGDWLKNKDKPFFQLAGYAGTGKTTLAKHLVESVRGKVYFAAYTGKAAHVLSRAGAPNVSTIHKLIYKPKDRSKQHIDDLHNEKIMLLKQEPVDHLRVREIDEELNNMRSPIFQKNYESPLLDAALVVVDEYSMIDKRMGEDLLSFNCPVLALGDPGQLPPVRGTAYFENEPDIMLTEIHRQAQDNPIIRLADLVRKGNELEPGSYGEGCEVVYGKRLGREGLREWVLATDQLLVGKNATRVASNERYRELLERTSLYPQSGDRVVCLRNDHEAGLLNGQILTVRENSPETAPYFDLSLTADETDGAVMNVSAHACYFTKKAQPDIWTRKDAQEFDYGYALTVHKAQGSQWDNVLLLDEWFSKHRRKWLYTAITRAAQSIKIVKM